MVTGAFQTVRQKKKKAVLYELVSQGFYYDEGSWLITA